MTTTPDEFLRFAKDMGLDRLQSTSLTNIENNDYTLTGLSVLNNLCHLIEQIHILKSENDRLRAHLDLVQHMQKFISKPDEKKSIQIYDEDKSSTLSPSNSLKIKNYGSATLSISSRERQGVDFVNNPDDSSSMMHIESEMMDSNSGLSGVPSWNNWSKVRHALKFSIRRKPDPPCNSALIIPAISISVESDDNRFDDHKHQKKKIFITNENRHDLIEGDTDHDDESIELNQIHQKTEFYRNNQANSSSNETNTPVAMDEEHLFTRKQSKIAHYRRKLRSKLNTVKKQFSDQHSASTSRLFPHPPTSTLDELGPGLNHALLTVQLAPAMTKSYQQKMRDWHSMQKSNFLVDYRRQSIATKSDLSNDSRKTSISSTINKASNQAQVLFTDKSISKNKIDVLPLSPTLSPNQRSLIVHQWREIMSEEISLRLDSEYLQKKLHDLKQLETDLKSLKTSIFCTNNQEYVLKHRSMTSIDQLDQDVLDQHRPIYLPQRCRSLQSLIPMPASWILAVQSAAYSDILDGTSKKTTDRAIIFNKTFFNQLNHFKNNRSIFEQNTFKNLPVSTNSPTNISSEENLNERRSMRIRTRTILTRGHLRKSCLFSPSEIPPLRPMIPLQTMASTLEITSHIDLATINETESNLPSSTTVNKRWKRSRFDFKKTLQRSKSMCMTQFHSWLQRRRQQHSDVPRRKSAIEPKPEKELRSSPCSTLKPLGSSHFYRKIFKQHPSPTSPVPLTEFPSLPSPPPLPSLLDDSDQYFKKQESPVRIYLPARTSPTARHVRIVDNEIKTLVMSKITSPIINRRNFPSAIKKATARERRESYVTLSNILNN